MPTCSVPMLTNRKSCSVYRIANYARRTTHRIQCSYPAFTLTELIVVVLLVSLFVLLAQIHLFELLGRKTFKAQAQELVSTMQMAASAAAESNKRYEVIIDLIDQSYTLRQITSPDLSQLLEEEIIIQNAFSNDCQISYVLFDDLTETDEDHQIAKFRAGHAGWQNGGKIVLLDKDEQPYSVVVNRANRIVALKEGDVGLLMPKRQDEVPF